MVLPEPVAHLVHMRYVLPSTALWTDRMASTPPGPGGLVMSIDEVSPRPREPKRASFSALMPTLRASLGPDGAAVLRNLARVSVLRNHGAGMTNAPCAEPGVSM